MILNLKCSWHIYWIGVYAQRYEKARRKGLPASKYVDRLVRHGEALELLRLKLVNKILEIKKHNNSNL